MTDKIMDGTSIQFYDVLADDYDEMTGFGDRFAKDRSNFKSFIEQNALKTAIDVGCGTGFHAILLSQLGLQMTATDLSEKMLHQTKENARRIGVEVTVLDASFQNINETVSNKFDAVFCLGNTLPHVLIESELVQLLINFKKLLNPEGLIVLQLLNYDRILKFRERIQSVKEANGKTFIRFYDYGEKILTFNVLRIQKKENTFSHTLNSVQLCPWRSSDVVRNLAKADYVQTDLFGSMALDRFDVQNSKDLIVLAKPR